MLTSQRGASNVAITDDYANTVALGSVFNMSFGSYFGDWDNKNNFLRAALASGMHCELLRRHPGVVRAPRGLRAKRSEPARSPP
ncbi:MAG: hypothetical protein IPO17_04285 [Flavobacteriales bacterium]|nr:hypothetical protein [Flavobacteriales bacterium]